MTKGSREEQDPGELYTRNIALSLLTFATFQVGHVAKTCPPPSRSHRSAPCPSSSLTCLHFRRRERALQFVLGTLRQALTPPCATSLLKDLRLCLFDSFPRNLSSSSTLERCNALIPAPPAPPDAATAQRSLALDSRTPPPTGPYASSLWTEADADRCPRPPSTLGATGRDDLASK